MDWDSPLGILRRAMGIERDGYRFYTEIAEMAASPQGRDMFLKLADEEALLTYELYHRQAQAATDPAARQTFEFLAREENRHYKLLQNTRDYLDQRHTWWDSEELPFFEG